MKKQIFAALFVLIMLLSGCSGNMADSKESNSEVVTDTEVTAENETENSLLSSGSIETANPEESEVQESTVTSEKEEAVPPKEESKPKETTSAATTPKGNESVSAATPPAKPAETESPKPAETQTQPAPEETKPKSAYDYPFDIDTIKADCIAIGKGMGLNLDTSLTPSNAANWNPVTASENSQGTALKQNLESYIKFHTVGNLSSYGIDSITDFNIYCEARGNGAYSIYFLFA